MDSADFSGGQLRVRITDGTSNTNRLSLGGNFTIDANGNILLGGIVIGERTSSGFVTSELIITLNGNANRTVVQLLIRVPSPSRQPAARPARAR